MMKIYIKASKPDPFRKGIHIFVGITEYNLRPVKAMPAYLACRGSKPENS